MRRLIVSLLLAALALASSASAQTLSQGAVLARTGTAITVANTTVATSIYSQLIPAFTFTNFTQQQYGATNLHLRLLGTLTTNAGCAACVGTVNLGCNYGGTTASIALVNASVFPSNQSTVPLFVDLWVRTSNTFAPLVTGRLQLISMASATSTAATVTGTTSVQSPQTLACTWQWASASATNSVTISSAVLVVGD